MSGVFLVPALIGGIISFPTLLFGLYYRTSIYVLDKESDENHEKENLVIYWIFVSAQLGSVLFIPIVNYTFGPIAALAVFLSAYLGKNLSDN